MNGSLVCSKCGQTFAEFQNGGLLGCAACYSAFASELVPILKRLHGTTQHGALEAFTSQTLVQLEAQLQDAVKREAYEEASDIRDRILALKKTTP